jgi:hypothetical protein
VGGTILVSRNRVNARTVVPWHSPREIRGASSPPAAFRPFLPSLPGSGETSSEILGGTGTLGRRTVLAECCRSLVLMQRLVLAETASNTREQMLELCN